MPGCVTTERDIFNKRRQLYAISFSMQTPPDAARKMQICRFAMYRVAGFARLIPFFDSSNFRAPDA